MTPSTATSATDLRRDVPAYATPRGSNVSAVSWGAIFAGAAAAAVLSLILLLLGTGLGLSALSPWANDGASGKALGAGTIVWVTFMQLAASAMGGYVAGRLRTKWIDLQTDEIVFRDTAHGFLAWALASIVVAAFATSSVSSAVSSAGRAISTVAGSAASTATQAAANQPSTSSDYFLDTLFRKDQPDPNASPQDARAEAGRILARSIANGNLEPNDRTYLSKLISARTGISQQDAESS